MHRLFVAVDLPETVKESLGRICTGLPDVRWVDLGQLHLTLRFIGDADDVMLTAIRENLSHIREEEFSLSLGGTGRFPPKGDPRVIWVGIDDCPPLLRLAERVEHALVKSGVEPERRGFSPHITIARMREPSPSRVAAFLARNRDFRAATFTVGEFHLYSSTLTPKGAVHRREATYPLHPRREGVPDKR